MKRAPAAPLHLALPEARHVLTEYESKTILGAAGLPVTREELAHSADHAVAAAQRIGFPVALKLQSPDLVHKTDAGALALSLTDEAAVRRAYDKLLADLRRDKPALRIDGLLVQEMVEDGVEFLLGMTRDPVFGSVLVFGLGGVFVELLGPSVQVRLPPFGDEEAETLLDHPAIERLLAGFRGQPATDRPALVALIRGFAAFIEDRRPGRGHRHQSGHRSS